MKIILILAVLLLPIVSAVSDTTPPSIVSFDFEPKVVDVSQSDQTINFTMQLKDDLSGVGYATIWINKKNNATPGGGSPVWPESDRVSGDNLNGTYAHKIGISKYSESGKWYIQLSADDLVGNRLWLNNTAMKKLGFPNLIEVKNIEVKKAGNLTPPSIAKVTAPTMAKKYETYENEYFKVEYPTNWKPIVWRPESTSFRDQNGTDVKFEFRLKNMEIIIHSGYTDFNRTGRLSEPIMHIMKTFQAKNVTGNAYPTEYKKFEGEYCNLEYPAKLSTYPSSPYWFGIVEQGNPIACNATFLFDLKEALIQFYPTYSELNRSGYLGEPWMHFLETFELKKIPKRG